jgi:glucose-6-phosphate isomerase
VLGRNWNCITTQNASMQEMFLLDATRTDKFNLKWNDFFTGLFKKHNQSKTIQLLLGWLMK